MFLSVGQRHNPTGRQNGPMAAGAHRFDAEVWEHEGEGAWHFVSLPEDLADEIEAAHGTRGRGFGAIAVAVEIGTSRWQTSIFPDSKRGTYLLPIRKAVRAAEGVVDGARVSVALRVVDRS